MANREESPNFPEHIIYVLDKKVAGNTRQPQG